MIDAALTWILTNWHALGAGAVGGVGPTLGLVKVISDRRARKRQEAAGSNFSVKDGVDPHGGGRMLRYAAVGIKGWEASNIAVSSVKLYWPPFTRFLLTPPDMGDPAKLEFKRRHPIARGQMTLTPTQVRSFGVLIELNLWTRICALWRARARIKVSGETIDGQARPTSLKLRSRRVDWDRPPQT